MLVEDEIHILKATENKKTIIGKTKENGGMEHGRKTNKRNNTNCTNYNYNNFADTSTE